jgi:uroporphyrinogen-III synthase
MSKPIAYVLSTRELSPSLVEKAAAAGVVIDSLSFIATEALEVGEVPARPSTVVFTSGNAVEAIEGAIGEGWKIFCTAGATRRTVAERFGETAIVGTAESAAALAETIIGEGWVKEVWFFCGDLRREELPAMLRQAGLEVHEVVVYKTRLTPLKIGRVYDGIAFFSPSAVESFFSVNRIPAHTRLFAIGGTTAEAIRQRCDNPVTTSERPEAELLINQIIHDNTEE